MSDQSTKNAAGASLQRVVSPLRPYYEDAFVTLYHGDCRELMPSLEQGDTCITDPVWPNSVFPLVTNPAALFAEMCALLKTPRLVVHLGCMSDPRFLMGVPPTMAFLRTCWLAYARPSPRGRILNGSDVAYAFGPPPPSRPGRQLLGGQHIACRNDTKLQHSRRGNGSSDDVDYDSLPHPAPRRTEHVLWLVKTFADVSVFDPFAGTGTTLWSAKQHGLKSVGIEYEERYCEIAAHRLSQAVFDYAPARKQPSAETLEMQMGEERANDQAHPTAAGGTGGAQKGL